MNEPPTPRRSERILKIAGAVVTLVALLSMVVGVWLYLERGRTLDVQWWQADREWNADTIGRLETIERDVAIIKQEVGNLLTVIEVSGTHWNQNFEELEDEHEEMLSSILEATYGTEARIAYMLGVHAGDHGQEVDGIPLSRVE